jgi:hypothetical protein
VGVSSAIRETASHLERRLQITLARLFHDYLQDMKRNNLKEDLRHVDRKLSESIAHSGRRIRSRDVSEDLYLLAYQAAARGHKFPIIQIGNTWVPGLEFHFDGDPWKLESRAAVIRQSRGQTRDLKSRLHHSMTFRVYWCGPYRSFSEPDR